MSGSILCLDLATQMGWCEGAPGEKPTSGSHRLAYVGASNPEKQGGLIAWLGSRLTTFRYRLVVYEAPLDPRRMGKKTNMATAMTLIGMAGVCEGVCNQTGHRVMSAQLGDVRTHLLGRKPQTDRAKQEVMAAVRGLGFAPRDDNEADAIALWLYASAVIAPGTGTNTSPLFGRR